MDLAGEQVQKAKDGSWERFSDLRVAGNCQPPDVAGGQLRTRSRAAIGHDLNSVSA